MKCPYEKEVGCQRCPFPDCMTDEAGKLNEMYWTPEQKQRYKSHHSQRSKEKERAYNRAYREQHREELCQKDRERYRKGKEAVRILKEMGVEI